MSAPKGATRLKFRYAVQKAFFRPNLKRRQTVGKIRPKKERGYRKKKKGKHETICSRATQANHSIPPAHAVNVKNEPRELEKREKKRRIR